MVKYSLGSFETTYASRQSLAETGGQVVSMWRVMSCFTGVPGEETLVRVGNSDSRVT